MSLRTTSLVLAALTSVFVQGTASAALQTYFTLASYNAAVAGLGSGIGVSAPINFDSLAPGARGLSFSTGGATFGIASGGLRIHAGTTTTANNFLGFDDVIDPEFGGTDPLTITLPAGTRAISLNVISEQIPDFTNLASLSVGSTSIDTAAVNGIAIPSTNFQSFFLGIVGTTPADAFTAASLTFNGSGFFGRVDDVRFAAVPEPTSLALLGVASLLGLSRRRKS